VNGDEGIVVNRNKEREEKTSGTREVFEPKLKIRSPHSIFIPASIYHVVYVISLYLLAPVNPRRMAGLKPWNFRNMVPDLLVIGSGLCKSDIESAYHLVYPSLPDCTKRQLLTYTPTDRYD